jgi:chromate transport protein ChrA
MWYLIGMVAMFLFLLIEYKQENRKQTGIDLFTIVAALAISLFWLPIVFIVGVAQVAKILDKLKNKGL